MEPEREAIVRAAQRAYAIRLQSGDGGNLSIRLPGRERLLIKASGVSFGELTAETIVETDFYGEPIAGQPPGLRPSREVHTHVAIYSSRPDVSAIFHSHSPWSVSCAQHNDELPPYSLPLVMKVGCVPVLDVGHEQSNGAVANATALLVSARRDVSAFVQRGHGLFCMSDTITRAEHLAELVEEAAQIAVLCALTAASREA